MNRIGKLIPAAIRPLANLWVEKWRIKQAPGREFDTSSLITASPERFEQSFRAPGIDDIMQLFEDRFGSYVEGGRRLSMGASGGDTRWALIALAHLVKARRILEIGTHLGHGTMALATAARANDENDWSVVTVDPVDVNGEAGGWKNAGKPHSPEVQLLRHGYSHVEFLRDFSPQVLSQLEPGFDLIFVDGLHRSDVVYNEIAASLELLSDGGLLVLDDHCSDFDVRLPLPGSMPGPMLGSRRAADECRDLRVSELRFLNIRDDAPLRTNMAVVYRPEEAMD